MVTFARALVTGASSGIGVDFARQLAGSGTDLVLVARTTSRLEDLAAELRASHGIDVEVLTADLASVDGRHTVEERLRATDSPVDLLVNNAGFGTTGRFGATPAEEELGQIDVNVLALTRLTHAALPGMLDRATSSRQAVLNVSSTAGFQAMPHMATYAATKAFVTSFSESLHEEYRAKGVTITAVCPGPTRTEFADRSGMHFGVLPEAAWMDSASVARAGLAAVEAGRSVEVPGLMNKLTRAGGALTPSVILRRGTAMMTSRMNAGR